MTSLKVIEWRKEETGISINELNGHIFLPSVTLCPSIPIKSLNDVPINEFKRIINGEESFFWVETDTSSTDSTLYFNNATWKESFGYVKHDNQIDLEAMLVKCFTYDPPSQILKNPKGAKVSSLTHLQ